MFYIGYCVLMSMDMLKAFISLQYSIFSIPVNYPQYRIEFSMNSLYLSVHRLQVNMYVKSDGEYYSLTICQTLSVLLYMGAYTESNNAAA